MWRAKALACTGLALLLATGLAACGPNMQDQPKNKPQSASAFFADGSSVRPPIDDTVARGQARIDGYYYTGLVNGTPVAASPPR